MPTKLYRAIVQSGSCTWQYCADSCGHFEEEGVSLFPCFQNHPLTSRHERILPWKDTRNQDNKEGILFYMFCLESPKARWKLGRGLKRRILSFFILWHAHELDDMLKSVQPEVFFFLFSIWVFSSSITLCVCVCVRIFFFCIPHLSGVMNLCRDKRRNVHNTIHCNVPGKGLATCSYFLTDDPFLYPSTKCIPSLSVS